MNKLNINVYKFCIKLYTNGVYNIDGIHPFVNSIKHEEYEYTYYKNRIINYRAFGISLKINKFL